MKKAFLLSLGALVLSSFAQANLTSQGDVVQDKGTLSCQGSAGKISFEINASANTISFSDITAFGSAQILKDTPMGMEISYQNNATQIHFEYSWYYTAQYDLSVNKPVLSMKKGEQATLLLSGDDDDGAFFNDEVFSCQLQ